MTYKTLKGYTYVVTASEAVTITDSNGLVLEVPAGEQRPFTATTTEVEYSAPCTITQVRGNFSLPPADGGGGQITVDPTPTQGSTNAVSSGGVYAALRELPAPVPVPLTPATAMKNGGVYTVAADGSSLNYGQATLAVNSTAQIWLDCLGASDITFPSSWRWLTEGGAAPEFNYFERWRLEVVNDGLSTTVQETAHYATAARWVYTYPVLADGPDDATKDIYYVVAETNQGYRGKVLDYWPRLFPYDSLTNTTWFGGNGKNLEGGELLYEPVVDEDGNNYPYVCTLALGEASRFTGIAVAVVVGPVTSYKQKIIVQYYNGSEWVDASARLSVEGPHGVNSTFEHLFRFEDNVPAFSKFRFVFNQFGLLSNLRLYKEL